jgi:hypothetical protein
MLAAIQHRYASLLELPRQLTVEVVELRKLIRGAQTAVDEAKLGDVEKSLDALLGRLGVLKSDLETHVQDAEVLTRRSSGVTKMRQDIETFLVTKSKDAINTLGADWPSYRLDAAQCQGLFNEYVDLLRGVAVREAGFDRDLFVVADRLPLLWGPDHHGAIWNSLAIPARAERQMPTAAKVLRIGFPEWTVWALPLLQHEFAHVFVSRSPDLRRAAFGDVNAEYARIPEAIYLADAAAALVTGPAYGLAALLMRLDPGAVRRDQPNHWRSAVIITALERVARETPGPLRATMARLRAEWRAAVAESGGDVDLFDEGCVTYDPSDASKIDKPSDPSVTSVVDVVWKELKLTSSLPAWATSWTVVTDWAAQLRAEKAEFDAASNLGVAGGGHERPVALTLLLNASWLARVGVVPADDAPDEGLEALEERAAAWCTALVDALVEAERGTEGGGQL